MAATAIKTATVSETECAPDMVVTIPIRPGGLRLYMELAREGGPLVKCVPGSLTLVSPGRTHETSDRRLGILILAIGSVLEIPLLPLGSTFFSRSKDHPDYGYEPDESYLTGTLGKSEDHRPDLAVEVVVTNPDKKAPANCALLGVPEVWVWNIPRKRLVFYHLVTRGKNKGQYVSNPRSRAFPSLEVGMVLERLSDPTEDGSTFDRNCRAWVAQVLAPLARGEGGR
jgi:Uma2 family endonuclease